MSGLIVSANVSMKLNEGIQMSKTKFFIVTIFGLFSLLHNQTAYGSCIYTGGVSFRVSSVDKSGSTNSQPLIQTCLDKVPIGGWLELEPGVYRVDSPIMVKKNVRISTAGLWHSDTTCDDSPSNWCAKIIGSPGFLGTALIESFSTAETVELDHIIIDGNRALRERILEMANICRKNPNILGNVKINGAKAFRMNFSYVKASLCNFGVDLNASSSAVVSITDNYFSDNGNFSDYKANGLMIRRSLKAYILRNHFYNNTGVALVLGDTPSSRVENNLFVQTGQRMYAAIALTNLNWKNVSWADHRGSTISRNYFSTSNLSEVLIQVGAYPFVTDQIICGNIRTMGGSIFENTFVSTKQHINITCGGISDARVIVGANAHFRPDNRHDAFFEKNILPKTSDINVSAPEWESFVDIAPKASETRDFSYYSSLKGMFSDLQLFN